jgi:glyoxylase-like metal-dependent hydrolase (beta-lactamase superfamily II)/ferredoxin
MARTSERLPENAPGDLFVDESCIDCETCRLIAPELFGELDRGLSFVARQPASPMEQRLAARALVACPTHSIGGASANEVAAASRDFPVPLDPRLPDVLFCGYTSESSFGAWSYLIRRDGGNVLVDSPRAARPLFERIESLGGVRWMFLSHRDDVADHEAIRRRFGCERILHVDDVSHGTRTVERRVEGHDPVSLADDLLLIPVPGHTHGSMALLYRGDVLFTGDHLWGDESRQHLGASRSVCWYSWPEQTRSMERLRDYRFGWVLPGHAPGCRRLPTSCRASWVPSSAA